MKALREGDDARTFRIACRDTALIVLIAVFINAKGDGGRTNRTITQPTAIAIVACCFLGDHDRVRAAGHAMVHAEAAVVPAPNGRRAGPRAPIDGRPRGIGETCILPTLDGDPSDPLGRGEGAAIGLAALDRELKAGGRGALRD